MISFKTFHDLSMDIRNNLHKIQGDKYDLIVGLPRSGMIPAYMISLYLNINCTDLISFIHNIPLKKGRTRQTKDNLIYPQDANNILIIDDSILSGLSLKKDLELIPNDLKNKITTLAIYSSKKERNDVDIFFEYVPIPRIFEWNIFHHSIMSRACVDIDGVLCVDPSEDVNDDGERYINFILNAEPLFLPTGKIHSLVTSRLEKYREVTEKWLKKHNIKYDNLIMLDLPDKETRQKLKAYASHKAVYYKKSNTEIFIESNAKQAMEICSLTGKPVYSIENNLMYDKNDLYKILKKEKKIRDFVPQNIKKIIKKLMFYGYKI